MIEKVKCEHCRKLIPLNNANSVGDFWMCNICIKPMVKKPKKELIQIRVTLEEKAELRDRATEAGFSNISEYLRVTGKKRHR
jgi:hypothetical protein